MCILQYVAYLYNIQIYYVLFYILLYYTMYYTNTISYTDICIYIPIYIHTCILIASFLWRPLIITGQKYLCFIILSVLLFMSTSVSFLSGAFWNHVTHLYTDAETSLCIQSSLSICWRLVPGTLTDTKILNAFFKPLIENGLAQRIQSHL